ncbi:MAG: DsbA family protein [Bradyrhizobium sp.]|nr:DsbA family protein [Bradyrhizobium sp.]
MLLSRRAALAAAVLTTLSPSSAWSAPPDEARNGQSDIVALLAKPVGLPDMVLGSATAPITVVEYSSLTCPHCAAFAENVFPMLQQKYIDTGKVRFVSREFPLDLKAAAASMLARCIARDDAPKFFEITMLMFHRQQELVEHTADALTDIGAKYGMSQPEVESCVKSDAALDKLQADQNFAYGQLKVGATPTFFINGEQVKGSMSFEEFEARLTPLLRH